MFKLNYSYTKDLIIEVLPTPESPTSSIRFDFLSSFTRCSYEIQRVLPIQSNIYIF